jgi:DNA helicase-2/ATP-dependent DNA helicase PcrA
LQHATEQGISVPEAFGRAGGIEGLNAKAVAAVQRLQERLSAFGREGPGADLAAFIERVVETFAYRDEIARCYPAPEEARKRALAIDELVQLAARHAQRHKRPSLGTFLAEMTLGANDEESAEDAGRRNCVTLMTLHAAKGLEFRRVFLVGLEEGILPHLKSVAQDSIEEERRLTYVGITRAREGLTVSHTLERSKYGRRVLVQPSRFLFELKGCAPPPGWVPAGGAQEAPGKPERKGRRKGALKAGHKRAARRR